jgi:carbamoyltransferase
MMVAAMRVGVRDSAAALGQDGRLAGVCAQERVMRVRGGPTPDGVPDEALDLLLQRAGRTRGDITRLVQVGGGPGLLAAAPVSSLDDHFAHACTAYLTGPFTQAAVVVCDHDAPSVSVWLGRDSSLVRVDTEWSGPGFSHAYSRCATALGFTGEAADQRFEALARLGAEARHAAVDSLFALDERSLQVDPAIDRVIAGLRTGAHDDDPRSGAGLAASLQGRLADLFIAFLERVRERVGVDTLCVGGSLFYHSAINTRVRCAGIFRKVFVPIDPGNSGVVAGAVLHGFGAAPALASPFLGPTYSSHETKEVLDNCKLQYDWQGESAVITDVVEALVQGRLVAWFDDAMEWGPRALGARSILASPFAPYVLENLNRFLKHREPWRGYALSGLQAAVAAHFDGPADAPFMECDYKPRDPETFRQVLPSPTAAVRLHTVNPQALPRFTRLLDVFGGATGLPFLVNTSFNGFHEPAVCSPRDAVRVFYGSGLDMLVMNGFVLRK